MFDDQPIKNTGQVPGNLPISEPDDMFSGTEETETIPVSPSPSTALNAGILKPKMGVEAPLNMPRNTPPSGNFGNSGMPPSQVTPDRVDNLEEPVGRSKLVLTLVVIVIVALLGTGVVWGYFAYVKNRVSNGDITTDQTHSDEEKIVTDIAPVENTAPNNQVINAPVDAQPIVPTPDEQVLFGEPVDTDGDSLTDDREKELGTNTLNWDTDGDGLSDGDEVNNWKTNPLDKDTDKDTFSDGVEVKNGYNPNGLGRFVDVLNTNTAPPVETTSNEKVVAPSNGSAGTTTAESSATGTITSQL